MRILVVMTGGTIGSVTVDGVTNIQDEVQNELVDRYKRAYGSTMEFEVIRPYNLLSENLTPKHWETLYRTIREVDVKKLDGIILTHGSDTLSYTSAMCAQLFRHLDVPFVITAANHPLDHEESNGLSNFHTCVTLISSKKWMGVFTVYRNDLGEDEVFLAERIEEADGYFGRFGSFGGKPFAKRIRNEIVVVDGESFQTIRNALDMEEWIKGDLAFRHRVLVIPSYPGLRYDSIHITRDTKAVMLCLYHSSTACVEGEGCSAVEFIKECKGNGTDVYLYFVKPIGGRRYVTTDELIREGGIPIGCMSKETAYTKLLLAYNQDIRSPKEFFQING